MTFPVLALADIGWLTGKLLRITLSTAEWVLWLLVALSVVSLAVMLERAVFFRAHDCRTPRRSPSASPAASWTACVRCSRVSRRWRRAVLQQGLACSPRDRRWSRR